MMCDFFERQFHSSSDTGHSSDFVSSASWKIFSISGSCLNLATDRAFLPSSSRLRVMNEVSGMEKDNLTNMPDSFVFPDPHTYTVYPG